MEAVRRDAVVIVDDDPGVLASFEFLLQASGYVVIAYASPTDLLRDGTARAACLVVDQHMPEMTGLELIARLREEHTTTPAALVSSDLTSAVRARARAMGVPMLAKPIDEGDLLGFVGAYLKPDPH